jgi:hypothetical protein
MGQLTNHRCEIGDMSDQKLRDGGVRVSFHTVCLIFAREAPAIFLSPQGERRSAFAWGPASLPSPDRATSVEAARVFSNSGRMV